MSRVKFDPSTGRVTCVYCGREWSPILLEGGRLPPGWNICPHGCSAKQAATLAREIAEDRQIPLADAIEQALHDYRSRPEHERN
jgi:hypothetical protein